MHEIFYDQIFFQTVSLNLPDWRPRSKLVFDQLNAEEEAETINNSEIKREKTWQNILFHVQCPIVHDYNECDGET